MLESLSQKLLGALGKLKSRGTISQSDINSALREVRLYLLEADVNYNVVRSFTNRVKEKSSTEKVFGSLSPGDTVIKIVHEELVDILGGEHKPMAPPVASPTTIMLVGLQGSGKTTAVAKIAHILKKNGRTVTIAACDLQRLAAVEQIQQLGKATNTPVYSEIGATSAISVAKSAQKWAQKLGAHYLIIDTAGRQATNEKLISEISKLSHTIKPTETFFILDAMMGQDAIKSAKVFHENLHLTGIVLTKMDGDARGGAVLSIRSELGIPVKFITTGERPHQIEEYKPASLASRILNMGDVETLVQRAQEEFDRKESKEEAARLIKGNFDMNDYVKQLSAAQKMGSINDIIRSIPGLGKSVGKHKFSDDAAEKQIKIAQAIVSSMTLQERARPEIIKGSRRKRIAIGSGTTPSQVNQVLNQHLQMRKMFKRFKNDKRGLRQLTSMFR